MKYDIFISYRPTDRDGVSSGTYIAQTIKQELELVGYQGHVFCNDSGLNGKGFEEILDIIEQCKIFILLLTKDSMMRCVEEGDLMCREIMQAQKCGLSIIPIEPDNLFNGYPEGLPEDLAIVKQTQHTKIHIGLSFGHDIQSMVKSRINPILPAQSVAGMQGALVRVESNTDCHILWSNKRIGIAYKGLTEIHLPKGHHELIFFGVENDAEHFECVVDVDSLETTYYVEVKCIDDSLVGGQPNENLRIAKLVAMGKGRDGVYQVGDYYCHGDVEGIVFWVDETATHGKILSLDQAELQWCTDYQFSMLVATKAIDPTDGMKNTNRIMRRLDNQEYPAFKWCRDKGENWYLPTVEELLCVAENYKVIDEALEGIGAMPFSRGLFTNDGYWSSQEKRHRTYYSACFVYMGSGAGVSDAVKSDRYNVRAVLKF